MELEIYASPFVRACIGIATLLVALGLLTLMVTPLVNLLK